MLFLLAAVEFLAGSLSWVAGARRAYHRALVVEHGGLQAAQWRSLAAKDALAGALLLSLVPVLVAVWFVIGDVGGHGLEAAGHGPAVEGSGAVGGAGGLAAGRCADAGQRPAGRTPRGRHWRRRLWPGYSDGVLRYANAGHLPGHLVNGGTGTAEQSLAPTGPLLGLVEHPVLEEREVALAPGFRVVVLHRWPAGGLQAAGWPG